jgi:hypothetical protein
VYYIIKYTILKVCISDVDDVEGVRAVVFNIISDVDDVEGVRVVVLP